MTKFTESDIIQLLEHWSNTKEKISKLEEQLEKYKKLATKIMDSNELSTLESQDFILKRRNQDRTFVTKSLLPKDIWDQYAKKSTFTVFTITKK